MSAEEFIPIEYKVVEIAAHFSGGELEHALNELGKEGWDLVACWEGPEGRAIFKRC